MRFKTRLAASLLPFCLFGMVSEGLWALSVRYLTWTELAGQSGWVVYAELIDQEKKKSPTDIEYTECHYQVLECFKAPAAGCPGTLSVVQADRIMGAPEICVGTGRVYLFVNPRHNIVGVYQGLFYETSDTVFNPYSPDAFTLTGGRLVPNEAFNGRYTIEAFRNRLKTLLGGP